MTLRGESNVALIRPGVTVTPHWKENFICADCRRLFEPIWAHEHAICRSHTLVGIGEFLRRSVTC